MRLSPTQRDILASTHISALQKVVLLAIMDAADQNGVIDLRHAELMRRTGIGNRTTIWQATRRLGDIHLIDITTGVVTPGTPTGTGTLYTLSHTLRGS